MGLKKYIPGSTEAIKIVIVVVVIGAVGGIAFGQNWIRTHLLGRL